MTIRLLSLLVVLAALPLDALAQNTYSVWLKGIECIEESDHVWGARSDEPFLVIHAADRRDVTRHHIAQDDLGPFDTGSRLALNYKVWEGSVQTVRLDAQVWDLDSAEQRALEITATVGLGAALGAIGAATGGVAIGAAAGAGGAGLGYYVQDSIDGLAEGAYDFMGQHRVTLELHRAGALADRPQHRRGTIHYDLTTDHEGDGARYRLYWEVRRN